MTLTEKSHSENKFSLLQTGFREQLLNRISLVEDLWGSLVKNNDNKPAKEPGKKNALILTNYFIATLLSFIFLLCFPPLLIADDGVELSRQSEQNKSKIRIVMSAAFVSESGIGIYDDISNYLGMKLDRKVEFVSGFSYSTINTMFESGMADVGFVCGLPYVMNRDKSQPDIELLLAPIMKDARYKDKPVYYSYVIVHKDSKLDSFSALKGRRFVYNDEISNSGYNMPRAHLIDLGETSVFFSKVIRSGSHEESIRLVALGKADVSAVDSLVYDYDLIKNPEYARQTKIIKTLGPAGIPPIVISTKTPLSLRNRIRDIFLKMKDDPAGKIILDKALVDRFTIVDDSNYDGIRKMKKQAQDSGYQVIR